MLTKTETIEQYKDLETTIDNRFFNRFCKYLNTDEIKQCGFTLREGVKWEIESEWTQENIINELISDAKFGLEKAENERGISSGLMTEVCEAWLTILEDNEIVSEDTGYNVLFFKEILNKYGDVTND